MKFAVVGGFAVRAHGFMRFTDDLDIVVDRSPSNMAIVSRVLIENGGRGNQIDVDTVKPMQKFYWSHCDGAIEFLTSIDGVSNAEIFESLVEIEYSGIEVPVIGRSLLLEVKKLASDDEARGEKRETDRRDYEALSGKE